MGNLKSRLNKIAGIQTNNLSRDFCVSVLDLYTDALVEEYKKSDYIKQLPQEDVGEFLKFVKETGSTCRDFNEFDYIFNPIVDIINKAAKEAVENGGDIDIEIFNSDKE